MPDGIRRHGARIEQILGRGYDNFVRYADASSSGQFHFDGQKLLRSHHSRTDLSVLVVTPAIDVAGFRERARMSAAHSDFDDIEKSTGFGDIIARHSAVTDRYRHAPTIDLTVDTGDPDGVLPTGSDEIRHRHNRWNRGFFSPTKLSVDPELALISIAPTIDLADFQRARMLSAGTDPLHPRQTHDDRRRLVHLTAIAKTAPTVSTPAHELARALNCARVVGPRRNQFDTRHDESRRLLLGSYLPQPKLAEIICAPAKKLVFLRQRAGMPPSGRDIRRFHQADDGGWFVLPTTASNPQLSETIGAPALHRRIREERARMGVFVWRIPLLNRATQRDFSHRTGRRHLGGNQNHSVARSHANFARNISPPAIQVTERRDGTGMIETRCDVYWIIACRADARSRANNPAAAAIRGVVDYVRFTIRRHVAIGKSRRTNLPAPGTSALTALTALTALNTLAALAGAAAGAKVTRLGVATDEKRHAQRYEI